MQSGEALFNLCSNYFKILPRNYCVRSPSIPCIWIIFLSIMITDASKSGVAQETIQNTVRRGSKAMMEQEARQILGVTEQSTWEEILQKYDTLFERNAKNGSFYLQSKVHRAKECLEAVHQGNSQGTPSWEPYGLTLFPYPWWRPGIWKLCQKEHRDRKSVV